VGKIVDKKDRVVVEMELAEILAKPFYTEVAGKIVAEGDMAGALIKLAWQVFQRYGGELADKQFSNSDVIVSDGKIYVSFFRQPPLIRSVPQRRVS
jgi:hypothetical protein